MSDCAWMKIVSIPTTVQSIFWQPRYSIYSVTIGRFGEAISNYSWTSSKFKSNEFVDEFAYPITTSRFFSNQTWSSPRPPLWISLKLWSDAIVMINTVFSVSRQIHCENFEDARGRYFQLTSSNPDVMSSQRVNWKKFSSPAGELFSVSARMNVWSFQR